MTYPLHLAVKYLFSGGESVEGSMELRAFPPAHRQNQIPGSTAFRMGLPASGKAHPRSGKEGPKRLVRCRLTETEETHGENTSQSPHHERGGLRHGRGGGALHQDDVVQAVGVVTTRVAVQKLDRC